MIGIAPTSTDGVSESGRDEGFEIIAGSPFRGPGYEGLVADAADAEFGPVP